MKMPRPLAFALGGAAILALSACGAPADTESDPTTLRIGVAGGLDTTWDPVNGSLLYGLPSAQPVYEPLVSFNVDGEGYDPVLAADYEIAENRRTITFTIRDDVDFTDGEHLTAEVAKNGIEAVLAGAHFSTGELIPFGPTVLVTSEYELEITTESGITSRFMNALTYLPIVGTAALDDPEGNALAPVGTGPYLLDETVPEVSQSFVRNPDYRDPDAFPFDRLEFHLFADPIAAVNALKSGQIDMTEVPLNLIEEAERSGFSISTGAGLITALAWVGRNPDSPAPLQDVRVRQAISYAIDRESIAENIDLGYGTPSSQPFSPVLPEYVEGGDDRYPYDPEKARELLAEAGYPDGFDLVLPGWPGFANEARLYEPALIQALADVGITVTVDLIEDAAEYFQRAPSGEFAFILYGTTDAYWVPYLGRGGFLSGAFHDAEGGVDPRIADMMSAIVDGDDEERAAGSAELGEYLLEEAWYIPISRSITAVATIPGIEVEVGEIKWPLYLHNIRLVE